MRATEIVKKDQVMQSILKVEVTGFANGSKTMSRRMRSVKGTEVFSLNHWKRCHELKKERMLEKLVLGRI